MTKAKEQVQATPKSRPETAEKRQAILVAANEVFGQRGYNNASLAEIAQRVGMTRAGVLHHFGSKENLLLESVSIRDTSDVDSDDDVLMPVGRAQFEHLIKTAFRNAHRPGIVQNFVVMSSEAITNDHPTHGYYEERYHNLRLEVANNFRELCEEEGIEDTSTVEDAAASILAVMDGLQYQWLLDPECLNLGEATAFAINAIVDAVLGPRS